MRREVADVFHIVCGVYVVDRWVAGGLRKDMGVAAALWCAMHRLRRKS